MQQVPALVQGDLELLQPLPVGLARVASGLGLPQGVLGVRQLVDALDDLLVVHVSSVVLGSRVLTLRRPARVSVPRRSAMMGPACPSPTPPTCARCWSAPPSARPRSATAPATGRSRRRWTSRASAPRSAGRCPRRGPTPRA